MKIPAICFLLDYRGTGWLAEDRVESLMHNIVQLGAGDRTWQPGLATWDNQIEICCTQTYRDENGVLSMCPEISVEDAMRLVAWVHDNCTGELEELWFDDDWQGYRYITAEEKERVALRDTLRAGTPVTRIEDMKPGCGIGLRIEDARAPLTKRKEHR
jgi:hypothetical protein